MRRSRGTTLVEVMLATVLSVILIGALVLVYGFVVLQSSRAFASASVLNQAELAATEIGDYVRNSKRCSIVQSGTKQALVCLMPLKSVDKNNDGRGDEFDPDKVAGLSIPEYGDGQRVWFYLGDPAKDFGAEGTILCKAIRNDDAVATSTDVLKSWSFYYDRTVSRWNLISGFTFSVDPSAATTTFTIRASTLARAERQPDVSTPNMDRYDHTITRTIHWRYWRP